MYKYISISSFSSVSSLHTFFTTVLAAEFSSSSSTRGQELSKRSTHRERSSMEKNLKGQQQGQGGAAWMTVPAFGDWDMKNGALPDYSMDFSKIREMRKQNKKELSRTSIGGDDDLLAHQQRKPGKPNPKLEHPANQHHDRPLHGRDDSPTGRRTFLSYFQCCIKA